MNDWQRVIKQMNAPWIHLSDLKGTPSALTEAYGVLGVPHSLLIDENGIITAVKVNGQGLEMILEQMLGDVACSSLCSYIRLNELSQNDYPLSIKFFQESIHEPKK